MVVLYVVIVVYTRVMWIFIYSQFFLLLIVNMYTDVNSRYGLYNICYSHIPRICWSGQLPRGKAFGVRFSLKN